MNLSFHYWLNNVSRPMKTGTKAAARKLRFDLDAAILLAHYCPLLENSSTALSDAADIRRWIRDNIPEFRNRIDKRLAIDDVEALISNWRSWRTRIEGKRHGTDLSEQPEAVPSKAED